MITEDDVKNMIIKKNRKSIASYIALMFFMPAIFALMIGAGRPKNLDIFMLMTIITGIIATFIVDYFIIWKKFLSVEIRQIKDPWSDPVFRVFHDPIGLTVAYNEAAEDEAIYESNGIKLTKKYIVNTKNPLTLMRLDDVTDSYVTGDPNDEGGKMVVVNDCHDRTCHYSITGDREAAMHLCRLVFKHAPRLADKKLKDDSVVVEL